MKSKLIIMLSCLCLSANIMAKDIIVGTSLESDFITPFNNALYYSTDQSIYGSEEINQGGILTSLSFYVSKSSPLTTKSLKIYLGHKDTDTFADENDFLTSTELAEVYSGNPTIGSKTGWEQFDLTTPFQYDGKRNLVIVVCRQSETLNQALEYQYTYYSGKNINLSRHSMTDKTTGTLTGDKAYSSWTWRANVKLTFEGEDIPDYCVDGIHYRLNPFMQIATVIKEKDGEGNYDNYPNEVMTIPNVIDYNGTEFIVKYIDEYAFYNNATLKQIILGNNIKEIGDYSFSSTSGLERIKIPNSIKYIPAHSFNNSNLSILDIEDSDNALTIEYSYDNRLAPFDGCNLDSVYIGRQLEYTDSESYYGYGSTPFYENRTTLRSVVIGENVTSIGTHLFRDCTNLKNVEIKGNNLTTVGNYAFYGCTNIQSLVFPESTTIFKANSLQKTSAKPLIILGKDLQLGESSIPTSLDGITWVHNSELNNPVISELLETCKIRDIDNPIILDTYSQALKSIIFSVKFGEYYHDYFNNGTIKKVTFDNQELTPDETGRYHLSDLSVAKDYYITVHYAVDAPNPERTQQIKLSTVTPKVYLTDFRDTQTTLTVLCSAISDATATYSERGVIFNGKNLPADQSGDVKLTDLTPDTDYTLTGYAIYDGVTFYSERQTRRTKKILLYIESETYPTSLVLSGECNSGDAKIVESTYSINGESKGRTSVVTGLEPKTKYEVTYIVTTDKGYSTSTSTTVTTKELQFEILSPKPVSATNSIVAATTNISEDETNVGFQWKKYDAPESLKPNEGYAAIYDGQLEGYIKNLQPTSYYNVRAFYKSAAGKYYYSDWATFDPSDFSYFEPTVHTYPVNDVTANSVKVKGYVMAGTEDIIEQGFQYWALNGSKIKAMYVIAANNSNDINTVFATGQVMSVTLENLSSGTTYCCRAFVKTATETTYGEEQTFTTDIDETTGIVTVEAADDETEIIGYYNLTGQKFDAPQHGVNIVRYRNGTTKKIFVK